MPPIDLKNAIEDANRKISEDQLWATRGKAIQAYARLEQALCGVFSDASATSQKIAAIIFFRIGSASARNQIIEKLLRLRHGDSYNLFWNSIFKAMPQIDNTRNAIVHWTVVGTMELPQEDSHRDAAVVLRPPTYWSTLDESAAQITNDDLVEYMRKCDFYANYITTFSSFTSDIHEIRISPDDRTTLRGIFQQPLVYTPPADTPQSRSPPEPDTPPPSSPG